MPRNGEMTYDEHSELVRQGKKAWYVYSRNGDIMNYYASAIYTPEDRLGKGIIGFKNFFHAFACHVQIKAQRQGENE